MRFPRPICHRRAESTDQYGAVAAKVAPENFEKAASWQFPGQIGDSAGSSDSSVKIKHHVGIDVSVEVVAMMPSFAGRIIPEIKRFAAWRTVTGTPP